MRLITLIFCFIFLLSSCRKDKREFTSDFPNGYRTEVYIDYYEYSNTTDVSVGFIIPSANNYYYQHSVLLPAESYLKYNGIEMTVPEGYSFYQNFFDGKAIGLLEFLDYDGTIYKNSVIPPDTAYFINLPDTISSLEDVVLRINPPIIDSSETSEICLNGCSDDYGDWLYHGTDSIFTPYYYPTLESEKNHVLYLYRTKYIQNTNFPLGGGSIRYRYIAKKTFYAP